MLLLAPSLSLLLFATVMLGIGQTLVLAALQLMISRCSSRSHRDSVLGNYMVAISLGQAIGPLLMSSGTERFAVSFLGAALLVMALLILHRKAPAHRCGVVDEPIRLSTIAATPGLTWLIVIGSACVASQDLVLAFLPLLGVEQGIAPGTIGLLLSLRAIAAMISRIFFSRAIGWFGTMSVMTGAALAGGVALVAVGLPLPVWGIGICMIFTGFGLGIALTSTVALTLTCAPPSARGTALSLRLTANRLAQFIIPIGAGFIIGPLGPAGVIASVGLVLVGIVLIRPSSLKGLK